MSAPAALLHPGRLGQDPLLRNAFFLLATSVTTAVFGFGFWALNARLYDAAQIGVASTVLSAVSMLSYLSLLGTNNLLIRDSARPDWPTLAWTATALVGLTGVAAGLAYLATAGRWSTELHGTLSGAGHVAGFLLLCVASSVNVLTDAAFVARRRAHWNLALNAVLQGVLKLGLTVALVRLGPFGILLSCALAVTACSLASLVVLGHGRPVPPLRWSLLRGGFGFSAATYASSALNLAPLLAVPTIVLSVRGGAEAGTYFLVFQIANLVYAVAYAVGESLFAEGSAGRPPWLRSAIALGGVLLLVVPPAWLAAPAVLGLFGPGYAADGLLPLRLLLLGAVAVAADIWAGFALKTTGRMRWLLAMNAVHAGAVIGLTVCWLPGGLPWVAAAWCAGNLLAALVAATPFLVQAPRLWAAR